MKKYGKRLFGKVSLSVITMGMVMSIVCFTIAGALFIFLSVYKSSVEEDARVNSEQAVVQVSNTVNQYIKDMLEIMALIEKKFAGEDGRSEDVLRTLLEVRSDVVAVLNYDTAGNLREGFTNGYTLKKEALKDLSFAHPLPGQKETVYISQPHVESLLENYYPWVVSIARELIQEDGTKSTVVMDIRFSQIADYVDDVGIGQHGYSFIMDRAGNIIYHPQQQLIYSGLKQEETKWLADLPDGVSMQNGVIYTQKSLENYDWRIVGVSYTDEVINVRIGRTVKILVLLLMVVLAAAFVSSYILSRMISRPIQGLVKAMGDFEKNAESFRYENLSGSREIMALSQSFGHLVLRIQELMEQVRNEEISLRKTELKALQAQINPHFLYNTLDAIGWLCEEENNKDAVLMVNALARLFRISISKGHELISIEKELEHAKSYLMIEQFRYRNFQYTLEAEETCLSCLCNKITLQPIIENAIYHGLDKSMEDGQIHIRIAEEGEHILMTVKDNGIGMSQEQCRHILQHEPGEQSGIGIKNVNDRIRIYFGESYGLTIDSVQDEGTLVSIRMPKISEGSYETK